ncbi:MAG: SMC-Scp complex subunit ScpB [Euryarchaeota archaeon]|nr:SMC-Scp complex subunit ScpB [Euryarchaeota archaeon]
MSTETENQVSSAADEVTRIVAKRPPAGKERQVVEAALFSAGKPVLIDEISEKTGVPKADVRHAIKALEKLYASSDSALEVSQAGDKWAMQLKAEYAPHATKLAPMEIPVRTLKTLALIAYHQPVKQSDVVDMIGARCYEHIKELHDRGLVNWREHGQTKILSTTASFPEYFGIASLEPEEIKKFLAARVGLKLTEKKPVEDAALEAPPQEDKPIGAESDTPPPSDDATDTAPSKQEIVAEH